jgi:glyoxylase-like metal-dependent hydrolase (beta-lactamase superfamily II)/8-oxo-dGTP pyrophosphatase MutT (NUDIX family)
VTSSVEPHPAATVVLLRPGATGLEVLLTHRPSTMAFAADMHVFPGGRVDAADHDHRLVARSAISTEAAAVALGGDLPPEAAHAAFVAAIREAFEEVGVLLADMPPEADLVAARDRLLGDPGAFPDIVIDLGLHLRTDRLVPLSRWVTPSTMPRRFDVRFFAAAVSSDVEVRLVGDEVAAHAWHTPRAALDAMGAGQIGMWIPTSATLQQLEHVTSIDQVRDGLAPTALGDVAVEVIDPDVTRVTMPAGGGVAGQPIHSYLVGRRAVIVVDPGDPTGPGLERAVSLATAHGGRIVAIALTTVDPDHAAGAEALAELTSVPILASPTRAGDLSHAVVALADDEVIGHGDVPLRVIATPGPTPDHLAFVIGDGRFVLAGDLDGIRGARVVRPPTDPDALDRATARLRRAAPDARWLPAHPA